MVLHQCINLAILTLWCVQRKSVKTHSRASPVVPSVCVQNITSVYYFERKQSEGGPETRA